MRAIGAWSHGILDYCTVILLAIGPSVAGFTGKQATYCYLLAAIHLVLTLLTRFPLGVMKTVSFAPHGAIEFLAGLLILALPWLAHFSAGTRSRNFYVAMALLVLLIWLLTDYRGLRGRTAIAPPRI